MGRVEAGESLLESAKREFEEETGHRTEKMTFLGTTNIGIGFANVPLHIFQAENIVKTEQALDDSEQGMTAEWIDLNTWEQKITHGEIIDNESLACWTIYNAQCFR